MASRTKRSLVKIRERLSQLAAPYEDIDSSVEFELEELLSHFDEFANKLDETVEWLNDEANY